MDETIETMIKQTPITDSDPYQILDDSPMFKLSLSSKELFHSNFLEWLSSMEDYKDDFKELILKMAGLNRTGYNWPEHWCVKREYNNFDLCIVEEFVEGNPVQQNSDSTKNDDQEKIPDSEIQNLYRLLFVIENKVKSIPYQEQLKRYSEEALKINDAFWNKRAQESVKNGSVDASTDKWLFIPDKLKNKKQTDIPVDDEHKNSKRKKDYYEDYKKVNKKDPVFILLTLAKEFPDKPDDGNSWILKISDNCSCEWKITYYQEYSRYVEECFLEGTDPKNDNLTKGIIRNYCAFINSLSIISQTWSRQYEDPSHSFLYFSNNNSKRSYFPDYIKAKEHRIHDLYQKLKFSYLCTKLYKQVQEKVGKTWVVFPSNQGGLFKDNDNFKSDENYICINYTYLHGDPLLEINIHPGFSNGEREYYYAIQVQGDSYERGIQVKATTKNEINAKKVWDLLESGDETLSIIDGWMSIAKHSNWGLTDAQKGFLSVDIVKKSSDQPFNKYDMSDGTFIYQKRRINNQPSIKIVIDLMIFDLEFVLKSLKLGTISSNPATS